MKTKNITEQFQIDEVNVISSITIVNENGETTTGTSIMILDDIWN